LTEPKDIAEILAFEGDQGENKEESFTRRAEHGTPVKKSGGESERGEDLWDNKKEGRRSGPLLKPTGKTG